MTRLSGGNAIWKAILLTAILALGAVITPGLMQAQSSDTFEIEVIRDLPYYDGPDSDPRKNTLDLYQPQGRSEAPVLIFVHGGGWTSGDKALYGFIGQTFAQRGFLTVVTNYRLSPEVTHPKHVQDVARAIAWVYRRIAQYGGDPERIVLMGHSAGGHLVSLVTIDERYLAAEGLDTTLIRGVIPISGVYDLTKIPGFVSVFSGIPAVRWDASPVAHVDEEQPPFLILYAQFDPSTLHSQAREFFAALTERDSEARLVEIPQRDHFTIIIRIGQAGDPTTDLILQFLDERIGS
jgi:acetyl esterase/lipase